MSSCAHTHIPDSKIVVQDATVVNSRQAHLELLEHSWHTVSYKEQEATSLRHLLKGLRYVRIS